MQKIESLKGARVALLGLGISQIDFVIGAENSNEWDEVWGINSACGVFNCSRVFMMDPPSRFLDSDDAGKQTQVMRRVLPDLSVPVYTCELDDRVPSAELYPIEAVCNYTKSAYFNNTVAYAIAFAYYHEVGTLELYGIDFSYKGDMHFAANLHANSSRSLRACESGQSPMRGARRCRAGASWLARTRPWRGAASRARAAKAHSRAHAARVLYCASHRPPLRHRE